MLIETLFRRLFEPDQSENKEIVQEIVNIHNGAIFKNGTHSLAKYRLNCVHAMFNFTYQIPKTIVEKYL